MTIAWAITSAVLVPIACLGLVLWLERLEDSLTEALQAAGVGDVAGQAPQGDVVVERGDQGAGTEQVTPIAVPGTLG